VADKTTLLEVNAAPHIHSNESAAKTMWAVCLALLPAGCAGVLLFGLPALRIILLSVGSCLATEALLQKWSGKKITLNDGSALLTGILLAYNLSASVPFWIPVAGGVFAIAIAKQAFGGLGMNIFNPALAGRAFLVASWPRLMTSFPAPMSADAVASATPLALLKEGRAQDLASMGLSYMDLLLGKRGGCIGETCAIALLIGTAYLLWKRAIGWHIPASFILSAGILCALFAPAGFAQGDFLFSVLTGGLILGAFFMATDYVTSPLTGKGQLIFGAGCGILTFLIRRFGGYPEGVSYSILIMNAFVPLIDRFIQPKRYGYIRTPKKR
jgi:Na+-translocating ferredoxin:NAD+ oxidoreductase subunit D